jgi:hypothetical protein
MKDDDSPIKTTKITFCTSIHLGFDTNGYDMGGNHQCHEKSVEQDYGIATIESKQLFAYTTDNSRSREYFQELSGCEGA